MFTREEKTPAFVPEKITEGRRHSVLVGIAGALGARGFSGDTVSAQLQITNLRQCVPPLPEYELGKIAEFVATKPAGHRNTTIQEVAAEVEIESFAGIAPESLAWLWLGKIPLGKLTLFCG